MATPTAGVTVTWNNVEFAEVVDLKVSLGGSLPLSREISGTQLPFSLDLGTIDVVCLGSANCSFSNYGKRASLEISGGVVSVTVPAIFEKLAIDAKVNDVVRYTVTFRLSPE